MWEKKKKTHNPKERTIHYINIPQRQHYVELSSSVNHHCYYYSGVSCTRENRVNLYAI